MCNVSVARFTNANDCGFLSVCKNMCLISGIVQLLGDRKVSYHHVKFYNEAKTLIEQFANFSVKQIDRVRTPWLALDSILVLKCCLKITFVISVLK